MSVSDDKRYLEFNLKDGWRYEERGSNSFSDAKTDYVRVGFKEYKKQFDLSTFQFVQTPDSVNRNNERVYSMRQLNKAIDSLKKDNDRIRVILDAAVQYSNLKFIKYLDSTARQKREGDSLFKAAKSLDELMKSLRDLVKRARAGGLRSSELTDPTITITNLGEQGVETVFGIIYPPQVALVGFGKVTDRPWVVDGKIVARPVVTASLSADHRVSDGHRGGLFLAAVDRLLQGPEKL